MGDDVTIPAANIISDSQTANFVAAARDVNGLVTFAMQFAVVTAMNDEDNQHVVYTTCKYV